MQKLNLFEWPTLPDPAGHFINEQKEVEEAYSKQQMWDYAREYYRTAVNYERTLPRD